MMDTVALSGLTDLDTTEDCNSQCRFCFDKTSVLPNRIGNYQLEVEQS